MPDPRPTKEQIHMQTAFLWSKRATCKRPSRNVGCIITTKDLNCILSIGYNGPPTKLPNDACRNIKGDCGCVHAEQNAISRVDSTVQNKIIFLTMIPCEACANLIAQSNIIKVYYCEDYRNQQGLIRLRECEIEVERVWHPKI